MDYDSSFGDDVQGFTPAPAAQEWLQGGEQYAVNSVPYDASRELRLEVHQAVRERLTRLRPIPTPRVSRRLVDNEVKKVVQAWQRRKEVARLIEDAVNRLPLEARDLFNPTAWYIRATQVVLLAIRQLGRDP